MSKIIKFNRGFQSVARAHLITTNQSIATGVWTKLQLNFQDVDNFGNQDTVSPWLFTCPRTGVYLCIGGANFAGLADGNTAGIRIVDNTGTALAQQQRLVGGAGTAIIQVSLIDKFNQNQTIEIQAYQDSGVNKDIVIGELTFFAIQLLSR